MLSYRFRRGTICCVRHIPIRHRAVRCVQRLRLSVAAPGLAAVIMMMGLALSDRRLTAHILRWTREHWLNVAAITAAATIATAVVESMKKRPF